MPQAPVESTLLLLPSSLDLSTSERYAMQTAQCLYHVNMEFIASDNLVLLSLLMQQVSAYLYLWPITLDRSQNLTIFALSPQAMDNHRDLGIPNMVLKSSSSSSH